VYSLGRWALDTALGAGVMVGVVGLATLAMMALRTGAAGRRRALADGLVLAAVGMVMLFTLVPARIGEQPDRVNLLPFRDLVWAAQGQVDAGLALAGVAGNLALFVPLGIALAIRWPSGPGPRLVALGLAVSLAVESGQALLDIGRLADVTDVLVNTAGTALGIWLWRWFGSRDAGRQPEAETR